MQAKLIKLHTNENRAFLTSKKCLGTDFHESDFALFRDGWGISRGEVLRKICGRLFPGKERMMEQGIGAVGRLFTPGMIYCSLEGRKDMGRLVI